jgi:hypothetical protein
VRGPLLENFAIWFKNMKAPIVLEKHRALIAWLVPRLAEFPKDQRFLLADRIQRAMLDIQELFVRAIYAQDKSELLNEINIQLDVVRLLMRTAKDMKYVSLQRHDFFSRSVDEVGRMTGGWKKSLNGNQSPGGRTDSQSRAGLTVSGGCRERGIEKGEVQRS